MTAQPTINDSRPDDALWSRCRDVVDAEVQNETVLMSVRTGRYIFMNSTASAIWRALERPGTIQTVSAAMIERFDVDDDECRRQVRELLQRLESAQMVECGRDDSGAG